MTTESEKILEHIVNIQKRLNCSMFDAALEFCDERDIDIEEFLDVIDQNIKDMLKLDAITNHKVQKKYGKIGNTLF